MAVGFENGSVMLFKGDVTRDRYESKIQIYKNLSGLSFDVGFNLYTDVNKKNENKKWQRINNALDFWLDVSIFSCIKTK